MPNEPISPTRLRQLRDQVIRYVYEHGAGQWGWGVPLEQVENALGITSQELQTIGMLLREQRLLPDHGSITNIGLNSKGQVEGERLGPSVPMQEPEPSPMVIHANYSIVQVAGANSTQSAQLAVDQSQLINIMEQIEKELPTLKLEPREREEAKDLLGSLRKQLADKLPGAASRAIGAALAAIIMDGGSKLGQVLLDILHINPS
jgi:hypothetical protein